MDKKLLITRCLFWGLTLLVMTAVFINSAQNASSSTQISSSFSDAIFSVFSPQYIALDESGRIDFVHQAQHVVRKSAHFGAYLLMASFCTAALNTYKLSRLKKGALAFAICTVFAASDEFHQLFVPGRSGQLSDVILDSAGALCGILITFGLIGLIAKLSKRRDKREKKGTVR